MKKYLVTKKAKQLKAALLAGIFGLSISGGAAHAYLEVQDFWGATTDSGGTLTFQDTAPQQLTITIDNTSDWSAIITGAVFNIQQDITSASILSFTDGDGTDILSYWQVSLNVDNNITPGSTIFDVGFDTITGINGGIFNDGTATNEANAFPDIATLVLSISSPDPWAFTDVGNDSILRTQRTGESGEGSDKITTGSSSTSGDYNVSEPSLLVLLGIGLLGQALVLRNRRRFAL